MTRLSTRGNLCSVLLLAAVFPAFFASTELLAQAKPSAPMSLADAALIVPALRLSISADIRAMPLAEALRAAVPRSELDFVWDASLEELARPVTLRAKRITVADAIIALIERSNAAPGLEVVFIPPRSLVVRRRAAETSLHTQSQGGIGALVMNPAPVPLRDVVVVAARYSSLQGDSRPPVFTREQLLGTPQIGNDALRAVSRLPGVTADDFTARFTVRGGTGDDILVLLDGVELIQPYHLQEFGGTISIVDARAVESLRLSTGVRGAEYGGRIAGVLDMRSLEPDAGHLSGGTAASLLDAGAWAAGRLGTGNAWSMVGRYGFPEYALSRGGATGDLRARYYDVLAKARFARGTDTVALHALVAGDQLYYQPAEDTQIRGSAGNVYLWATSRKGIGERAEVRQTVSVAGIDRSRNGVSAGDDGFSPPTQVTDNRNTAAFAARQDWRVNLRPAIALSAGAELARTESRYRYTLLRGAFGADPVSLPAPRVSLNPKAWSWATYATGRWRIAESTIVEAGARHDVQRIPENNEAAFSPSLLLAHTATKHTVLRAAFGRVAQFQRPYELDVADGQVAFEKGDRAAHAGVEVEHTLRGGHILRTQLYRRTYSRVRGRFLDSGLGPSPFPELDPAGNIRSAPENRRVVGTEMSIDARPGGALSWGGSYAWSRSRDRVESNTVPSPYDRPHGVHARASYTTRQGWHIGAAWQVHTGSPYTTPIYTVTFSETGDSISLVRTLGPPNGNRVGPYHRLDVRAQRSWTTALGRYAIFVDVLNAYDRKNPRPSIQFVVDGANAPITLNDPDAMLPVLANVGFRLEF
ncbi:MAG: TonB-dependent receptor plug domain-containing protein [Gemmatimonadaceae bacterium]